MANLREDFPGKNTLSVIARIGTPSPLPKLILTLFSKVKKLPKLRAGGEVICTMPKRKGIFSQKSSLRNNFCLLDHSSLFFDVLPSRGIVTFEQARFLVRSTVPQIEWKIFSSRLSVTLATLPATLGKNKQIVKL